MNANRNYNPLAGLNDRQIQRIFKIRANRKYLCSCCDEWSDTKLREVPDDSKKICQKCFDDNYFECFDCDEVQNQQDEDYHKVLHPTNKNKLVCICDDCNDNRKNDCSSLAVIGACGDCAKWFDEGKDFCKCCGFDLNSYNQPEEEEEEEDDCICESDKKPNPLCPDHQCCWACSTQSVPITLNEHSRLWLCDKCNDKGDWCRGCHKFIDEDGMCSPGCDYYQWEGVWTCHRCDTERSDEPYCKKCCHPDDIAEYAAEYTARCAPCGPNPAEMLRLKALMALV